MKKIAIFASGSGEAAERVVSLFNEGNRIRVELVVTDRENAEIIERLQSLGISVVYVPRELWHDAPGQLLTQLQDKEIELIAFDDFRGTVPVAVADKFSGRTVMLTSPEESPREVVAALNKLEAAEEMPEPKAAEVLEPETACTDNSEGHSAEIAEENPAEVDVNPIDEDSAEQSAEAVNQNSDEEISKSVNKDSDEETSKSVDEEWADTLKIDFDPSRLRSTPPPVPGAQQHAPEIPRQQPSQDSQNGFAGNQGRYTQQPASQNVAYKAYEHAIQPEGQEPMPPSYLIWSVLATVFCCFIPGIVAIIFSSQVSSRYITGDIEGSKRASEKAQIWIIVSFVLGLLSSTLYLPIMMMG